MATKRNEEMYKLYEEYKKTMEISKKARNKRQKLNREIREKYEEPYSRKDFNENKKDITLWNSMIRDLEESMKMIEMYLDYNDRHYLHKEYDEVKKRIYNPTSIEGEVPFESLYQESIPDMTDLVCDIELQEEIKELLDKVLTDRQKQVIYLYFWEQKNYEEIGKVLNISKQSVHEFLQEALEKLRNSQYINGIITNFK